MQKALDTLPRNVFHIRERRELQERMDELQKQADQCRSRMKMSVRQAGFGSVKDAETAYRTVKKEVEKLRREAADLEGRAVPEVKMQSQKKKVSVLKQLAEKQLEARNRDVRGYHNGHMKKGEGEL